MIQLQIQESLVMNTKSKAKNMDICIQKRKTLYKSVYPPINRKDDYQCLRHSAPLEHPANSLNIINQ